MIRQTGRLAIRALHHLPPDSLPLLHGMDDHIVDHGVVLPIGDCPAGAHQPAANAREADHLAVLESPAQLCLPARPPISASLNKVSSSRQSIPSQLKCRITPARGLIGSIVAQFLTRNLTFLAWCRAIGQIALLRQFDLRLHRCGRHVDGEVKGRHAIRQTQSDW
jgi:hypothetical protein